MNGDNMKTTKMEFSAWLEHSDPKIGKVTNIPVCDQIDRLDSAIRQLAGTDPLAQTSRLLAAYAMRRPLPPKD